MNKSILKRESKTIHLFNFLSFTRNCLLFCQFLFFSSIPSPLLVFSFLFCRKVSREGELEAHLRSLSAKRKTLIELVSYSLKVLFGFRLIVSLLQISSITNVQEKLQTESKGTGGQRKLCSGKIIFRVFRDPINQPRERKVVSRGDMRSLLTSYSLFFLFALVFYRLGITNINLQA